MSLPQGAVQEMTGFFVGALLPSTEAGRAGMPLRTTNIITQTGQKQTRGGFSSTPKGPRNPRASSAIQGFPQAKQLCRGEDRNRTGIKIAALFTTESAWKFRYKMDMHLVYRGTDLPLGGRLSHYYRNWCQVSRDPWVLETVQGYRSELHSQPQQRTCQSFHLDTNRARALTREVRELADKGAIRLVQDQRGRFFRPMFVVPKGEGSCRPVINLRSLNTYLVLHHFKMGGIRVVKGLIQKSDWMVKLGLKDAFLSVPNHSKHWRYLPF